MDEGLKLHEWLALGRQNGTIRDVQTPVYAYLIDERRARAWVEGIVTGTISERDALAALRRVLEIEEALAYSA